MNKLYGKIVSNKLEYAPTSVETESGVVVNPTEATYLAAGYKKISDNPPAAEEGCHVEVTGYTETADTITVVYKQVHGSEDKGTRVFSKLKLVTELKARDRWVLVKTWIEEKGYYDYYVAAQNFVEDNTLFKEAVAAIKNYTGMTDEDVEAILSKCIYEP